MKFCKSAKDGKSVYFLIHKSCNFKYEVYGIFFQMNFIVNLIKNKREAVQWMKVHKSGGSYGSFNFGFKPSNLCFLILDKEPRTFNKIGFNEI